MLGFISFSPTYPPATGRRPIYSITKGARCAPFVFGKNNRSGLGQGNAGLALILAAAILIGRFAFLVGLEEARVGRNEQSELRRMYSALCRGPQWALGTSVCPAPSISRRILGPDRRAAGGRHNGSTLCPTPAIGGFSPALCSPWLGVSLRRAQCELCELRRICFRYVGS